MRSSLARQNKKSISNFYFLASRAGGGSIVILKIKARINHKSLLRIIDSY